MKTQAIEKFDVMNTEMLSTIEGGGAVGVLGGCGAGGAVGAYFAGPVGAVYGCVAGVGFYNGYKH